MDSDRPASMTVLSDSTAALLQATQLLSSLPSTLLYLLDHLLEAAPSMTQVGLTLDNARWGFKIQLDTARDPIEDQRLEAIARGEGVGLVGRLALLEVEAKDEAGAAGSCLIKGGRVLHFSPCSSCRSFGTTLVLKDLFYNVPVRRLSAATPQTIRSRCLRIVERFAMSRPEVGFRVWEAGREDCIWRARMADSTKERFEQIHGPSLSKSIHPISSTSPDLTLKGFISLSATHSTSFQYLSLNSQLITSSDLLDLIRDLFASSSFAARAQAATDPGLSTTSPSKVSRGGENERSPRKAIRRPVFVLNLEIAAGEVMREGGEEREAVFEDWPKVRKFVDSVVRSFLEQQGFLKPLPTPAIRRERLFDGATVSEPMTPIKRRRTDERPLKRQLNASAPTDAKGSISFRDPITRKVWSVDRQTGQSRILGERRRNDGGDDKDNGERSTPGWLTDVLETWQNPTFPVASELPVPSTSIPHSSSKNALALPFHAVSSLSPTAQTIPPSAVQNALHQAKAIAQVDHKFLACLLSISGSTPVPHDKECLFLVDQHAADERVQVERLLSDLGAGFFANCRTSAAAPDRSSPPLTAISLDNPKQDTLILLTGQEHRMLHSPDVQLAFARWGITFSLPLVPSSASEDDNVQTAVVSLPSVVSERLLGRKHLKEGPSELTELVKTFLVRLEEEGVKSHLKAAERSAQDADEGGWMGAMRFCPLEIVDLINSKACRGAIMFNDPLSTSQSGRLIRQLSDTQLPLQCAHGRPSMILVADLTTFRRRSKGPQSRKPIDWSTFAH